MGDDTTIMAIQGLAMEESEDTRELCIERLYDIYAHSLYRYACAITRSPEDAEDALQEVFGKLARDRKRLVCTEAIKPYLYTAVRNASYTVLRTRRRRSEVAREWVDECSIVSPDASASIIESQVVRQAFAKLPADQREVLVLKIYDEMSFKEIAEALGSSINTVASRYRYAIAKLREALEADDNER